MFLLMQFLASTMVKDNNNNDIPQYSLPTILFEMDTITDDYTLIDIYRKGIIL